MTFEIIAALGPSVAAIRVEEFMKTVCLRAICLPCAQTIYYGKRNTDIGWYCEKCRGEFEPRDPTGMTNYYKLNEGEDRFTPSEWVARWWGCSPEVVEVTWK